MCIVQTLDKGKRQIREQGRRKRERAKEKGGSEKERSEWSQGYVRSEGDKAASSKSSESCHWPLREQEHL